MMYLMLIDTQEEKRDFVRIYDKYKYRDVFILKYSSHMSNSDIARILDISEGTVRQRIARGKELIKTQLEGGK